MDLAPHATWHAWRQAAEQLPWTEGQRRVLHGRLPLSVPGQTLQAVAGDRLSRARVHQIETEIRKRLAEHGLLQPLQAAFVHQMAQGQPMILEHWQVQEGFWHRVPVSTLATALRYAQLVIPGWSAWRALQEWNGRHMVVPHARETWDRQVRAGRSAIAQALPGSLGLSPGQVEAQVAPWMPQPEPLRSAVDAAPAVDRQNGRPVHPVSEAEAKAIHRAVRATYVAAVVAPMVVAGPREAAMSPPPAESSSRPWVLGTDLSATQVLMAALRMQGGEATVPQLFRNVRHLANPAGERVEAAEITLRTRLTAGVRQGTLERVSQGRYRLPHSSLPPTLGSQALPPPLGRSG